MWGQPSRSEFGAEASVKHFVPLLSAGRNRLRVGAEQKSHILAFVENLRVTSRLAAD